MKGAARVLLPFLSFIDILSKKAMATANKINSPESLQKTIGEFERQSEIMKLQEEYN